MSHSLFRHLHRLRCPSLFHKEEGACYWYKSSDLFGDSHCISLQWTPCELKVFRSLMTREGEEMVEKPAWLIVAKREGSRWKLASFTGTLEVTSGTLSEAFRLAASEIDRLDVSFNQKDPRCPLVKKKARP